ncbi:MAG: hypothetical protein GX928_02270 [Ruminococcaceae bacterium]|nr:hypothetical protein [Oscillospiraceae bacterium]
MKMDKRDSEAYRVLIERRRKALDTPAEIRKQYQNQFDEINRGLQIGLRSYVAYYITNGKNFLYKSGQLTDCVEIWENILSALRVANIDEFDQCCELLKNEYWSRIDLKEACPLRY